VIWAMVKKEFLLVLRDKHALLALFVLPAVFILIMSVAMRDQFSTKNIEFSLFIEDIDKSEMSVEIVSSIQKDKSFTILDEKQNAQFIVEIPREYEKDSKKTINITVQDSIKSDQIEVFKAMLFEHVLNARLGSMAESAKEYSQKVSRILLELEVSTDSLYSVKYNKSKAVPNSTQQSVPAWIVFGMFFIIIPMSTIYVNERKQNTLSRLNSMNVSILVLTFAKSVPYIVINQLQVWIMLGVGIFLVPYFDTPALEINGSVVAIILISIALSIAAIGISTLIAVSASSSEQATTIGGIFNILLGAIGGVMVPKFIMPPSMQTLSELSPMSWGLDGFLDIFLKSADASIVMPNALKLVTFGVLLLILSMIILHLRIRKGL